MQLNNPFLERLGVTLIAWNPTGVEMALSPGDAHGNRTGIVQGGVVATLMDAACGYAGLYSEPGAPLRHSTTISLTINFVAPARLGQTLRIVGRLIGQGRSIYFSCAEVHDASGVLVASAQGAFKRMSSAG